ncbi:MAG: hypothetical protein CL561_00440 [Alphaproteobacteria bacterium]|nr:hypothetical protein [Alphaproteobacteria bacterium]|tara:strand:- start:1070 stop:1972 length:903 start_codon:yes stop_codon:yes gene_type:complete
MVDRISSYSNTSKLIENNLRLQSDYAKGQQQVSSGVKSDSFSGVAKDTNRILSLESDYERLVQQTENSKIALERSEVVYDTIGTIMDSAQPIMATLNAALSGTTTTQDLLHFVENGLAQMESLLNTQVAGRYVFAGSATQTAPVDFSDADYGPAVTPSVADTDYYQGNSFVQSVETSDGYTVDYGVTADNATFEMIARAYDLVRNNPTDRATLEEAFSLLETGIDDLAELQANVSLNSQLIDDGINRNLDDLNLIDNSLADLKEVDLAEVTVRLQEIQAQLEASYSLTSTLLRLNLADYI